MRAHNGHLYTGIFGTQFFFETLADNGMNELAYEAMDKSGTVTIRVSSENDVVLIAVTDYGGGLDPAFADSIFEPFITSKNGGSGLGLVITKQIVESHHGTIHCDSRPGDGCTFTLTLPLTQS